MQKGSDENARCFCASAAENDEHGKGDGKSTSEEGDIMFREQSRDHQLKIDSLKSRVRITVSSLPKQCTETGRSVRKNVADFKQNEWVASRFVAVAV